MSPSYYDDDSYEYDDDWPSRLTAMRATTTTKIYGIDDPSSPPMRTPVAGGSVSPAGPRPHRRGRIRARTNR